LKSKIIVLDDFYSDPDEVRELALQQEFKRREGALYPGGEAYVDTPRWEKVRQELASWIPDRVDGVCPKKEPFKQGKFRLALGRDESRRLDRVHVDTQLWSGIIYLTLDADCCGGLSLFRNKETKSLSWQPEWFLRKFPQLSTMSQDECRSFVQKVCKDSDVFEQIGTIPMVYNRAILLMAHDLHGTGEAFGDEPRSGRLTQHFEFYA
jgi:hypothetical protein